MREHIIAAIRGVEGPELSIIVDYHVRAAVANNNLVARSFLTEELGYKVMFLTGVAKALAWEGGRGGWASNFCNNKKGRFQHAHNQDLCQLFFDGVLRPPGLARHT